MAYSAKRIIMIDFSRIRIPDISADVLQLIVLRMTYRMAVADVRGFNWRYRRLSFCVAQKKTRDFELLTAMGRCRPADDTIMSLAVAKARA